VRIDLLALDVTLNDQSTIPYDQITLLEKLGEGSFAKVYRVSKYEQAYRFCSYFYSIIGQVRRPRCSSENHHHD
jgi:hypothetical protein